MPEGETHLGRRLDGPRECALSPCPETKSSRAGECAATSAVGLFPFPPEGFCDPWAGLNEPRLDPHWSKPMPAGEAGPWRRPGNCRNVDLAALDKFTCLDGYQVRSRI